MSNIEDVAEANVALCGTLGAQVGVGAARIKRVNDTEDATTP